jgi:hypothetical protein
MAKFKIEWATEAGPLDERIVETKGDEEDGISRDTFLDELDHMVGEATDLHDGDFFKITVLE